MDENGVVGHEDCPVARIMRIAAGVLGVTAGLWMQLAIKTLSVRTSIRRINLTRQDPVTEEEEEDQRQASHASGAPCEQRH